jgi:hypothetical protein
MVNVNPQHLAFLRYRRRLVQLWPIVGITLWSLLTLFALYLWYQVPQLINFPWVANQITQGALPPRTVETMALILPIVFITLFGVLAIVILFGFGLNQIEKRYLKILAAHNLLPD